MNFRFLLLLPVLAVGGFVQTGLYGPVTNHPKAADVAPDFTYTKVLNVPVSDAGTPSLSGKLTVIVFFHDTTDNLESVKQWNALIDGFSGKSVRFVWITGEDESTLLPWLSQHPVKGWVLYDPDEATGRAYGMELPGSVIIGEDRKILGFHAAMPPSADVLNAALEGRTTTTPPAKATMKAFMESNRVLLGAEPFRLPHMGDGKPDFPPSYALHVSPSQREGRSKSSGGDFWSLQGFGLKDVIAELYGVNPIRVQLPATLDNDKVYDFALVLPEEASDEKLRDRFRQAFEDYFHITAARENRWLDVYVVTATQRKPPAVKARAEGKMISFSSSNLEFESAGGPDEPIEVPKSISVAAIRGVRTEGTVDDLCNLLESQLDRPVINETNREGEFEFNVESTGARNDFLDRLRDQSGLVITPAQRSLEVLVFRLR
jgi:uncharacterized protein (TIGR03435 family)